MSLACSSDSPYERRIDPTRDDSSPYDFRGIAAARVDFVSNITFARLLNHARSRRSSFKVSCIKMWHYSSLCESKAFFGFNVQSLAWISYTQLKH